MAGTEKRVTPANGAIGVSQRLDVLERIRVLVRFKWAILACLIAGAAGGYVLSSQQTKIYRGTAILLARTVPSQTDVFSSQQNAPAADIQDRNVATQIKILESPPVKAAVIAKIPGAPDAVGTQIRLTNEFTAQVSSRDPRLASRSATAYAQAYIDFQRDQSVTDITAAAASVATGVQTLQRQLDQIQAQIDDRTVLDAANHVGPSNDPTMALLQQQHQSLVQQQSVFQTKLNELDVNAQLKQSPAILVSPAKIPDSPYSPRPKRSAALAGLASLLLGLLACFLFDYLDDRITSPGDVEIATEGVAVLGNVPKVQGMKPGTSLTLVTLGPSSSTAEAFRSIRTNVQFLIAEESAASILVTSPSMAEGKTTVVGNLAITLGRAGKRVVVLDADMRKPRLHEFFGLDGSLGLSSVLSGSTPLAGAIQEVPGEPNIRLLPAGPVPANPSELLSSEWTHQLIQALEEQCDQLIIDTPPVLPVTDAVALSSRVDACILVAMAGRSKKRQLHRAIQALRQVNAPIMGLVVNAIQANFGNGYGYGYGYGYRNENGYGHASQDSKAFDEQSELDSVTRGSERGTVDHLSTKAEYDSPTSDH
jgi:non-specific protein-tyrosine kinase